MTDRTVTHTRWPAVGVGLPIGGAHAGPEAVESVATAADRLGFSSVSLSERLLLPAAPDWSSDFGLPDWPFYDAIESLTWVAAKTSGIGDPLTACAALFPASEGLGRGVVGRQEGLEM